MKYKLDNIRLKTDLDIRDKIIQLLIKEIAHNDIALPEYLVTTIKTIYKPQEEGTKND